MRDNVLAAIEAYYDAVPRNAAQPEDLSPFVLFVPRGAAWPYYARPQLGAASFTAAEVERVRERQRELRIPEAFEWVAETTPGLRAAALESGLTVSDHALMPLIGEPSSGPEPPLGLTLRLVTSQEDLGLLRAVSNVGFSFPGTGRGDAGSEHASRAIGERNLEREAFARERLEQELTIMAAAIVDDEPVAVGSHQPVEGVTEIVGVATLPAFRRRGIGAALTAFLTADARARGIETVFLSAGDDDVARMYERVGFQRIGTACIAEPGEHR
ncbi:MAG: GNAT family N-acetyltransferase [Chloroflexota bacterium]|nr:MAG: GNAT family N-acetyltransferase [Chloroflexota bacterium]